MTWNRRIALFVVLAAVCAATLPGCGYALAGRGSYLPTDITSVGIPTLINRSTFFDVEQVLTQKIREEFIGRGKYRVSPEPVGVDAVLNGEILGISVQPIGFTEQQLASRYAFQVLMRVTFVDNRTGMILWSNETLTFTDEYELSTRSNVALEGAAFLDQERTAFDRIANDVARSVVSAILEAF
jgi:hypothetical protein